MAVTISNGVRIGATAASGTGSDEVGFLRLLPSNYIGPDYIQTGTIYDNVAYPALANVLEQGFNADSFTQVTLPPIPSTVSTYTALANSGITTGFTLGSDYYFLLNNGAIYKAVGGNLTTGTFTYLTTLVAPGVTSTPDVSNASVQNNRLYFAITNNSSLNYVDLTDTTFATVVKANLGTLPVTSAIRVKFGNGVYVAINTGAVGTSVFTSTDGITWATKTVSGMVGNNQGIEYAPSLNLWVVVSTGTTINANMATVTDPINGTWALTSAVGATGHNGIKWNGTIFTTIPSTALGLFWSSTIGTGSWTSHAQAATAAIMTYIDVTTSGTFVASASTTATAGSIQTSSDGLTWTQRSTVAPLTFAVTSALAVYQRTICYGNTMVAFGQVGTGNSPIGFVSSTDSLVTLSPVKYLIGRPITNLNAPQFLTGNLIGLATEQGLYQGGTINALRTIDGGITWTPIVITPPATPSPFAFYGIISTPGRFCMRGAVASNAGQSAGTITYIGTSTDGLSWDWTAPPLASVTNSLLVSNNVLLAMNTSTGYNYSSNFGVSWAAGSIPGSVPDLVTTCGSGFFVYTITATSYYSPNGAGWAASIFPSSVTSSTRTAYCTSPNLSFAMYYVSTAPGTSFAYVSYDNGATWVPKTPPLNSSTALTSCIVNGWIMIFLPTGYIIRSRDGNNWDTVMTGFTSTNKTTWQSIKVTADGEIGWFGNSTPNVGFLLKTNSNAYSIPKVVSNTGGTEWFVRAK